MRRLVLLCCILLSVVLTLSAAEQKTVRKYNKITKTWATYPLVSIHDLQFNSPDSLHIADSVQFGNTSLWTVQRANHYGDTVVVRALVICPYKVITYTQRGWTLLLADTSAAVASEGGKWGGVLARVGSFNVPPFGVIPDTAQAVLDGFSNVEQGDIIDITVHVEEFPTSLMNTTTQLNPARGISIDIIGSGALPHPSTRLLSDFYHGPYIPGGPYHVDWSNGEPWEGVYVKFTNLTVTSIVNSSRQTWNMVDGAGNQISEYDASYNFAITSGETPPTNPDTTVTHFHVPPIGATIDSIKGFISSASGGENTRGFRICPLFIGDVSYGISKPDVFQHRRYPVVVTSVDTVYVQAKVLKVVGGYDIGAVQLFTSLNGGAWNGQPMTRITSDSIYQASILDIDGNPLPANTSVRYFIKATDNLSVKSTILANANSTVATDSSQGFFFYTVLDRPLTIYDVQYTPYPNGYSGYLGGVVSVSGIVTADSTDVDVVPGGPLNQYASTCWFIQTGTSPWNGIWVVKRDSASGAALSAMRRGDSVTVTGTVQENFDITRIYDSLVTIHSSGHPVPPPVNLPIGGITEPYEGMLVRLTGGAVIDTGITFADTYEYAIDDGHGAQTIIRRDGHNTYSNIDGDTVINKKILHVGDRIDTVTGLAFYSHSRWKVIPRHDDDYAAGEPYSYLSSWNLISIGRNQIPTSTGYKVSTLYPGALSNAFFYTTGYVSATSLQHRKGYWLKLPSARVYRQLGTKRTLDTVSVSSGWNLIGGLGNPIPKTSVSVFPGGNHLGTFYSYNGSYQISDTLQPAHGYWVKADLDGYFIESAPAMVPKISEQQIPVSAFNTITLTDNSGNSQTLYFGQDTDGKLRMRDYEMPPPAPEVSGFDARFSSNRILEAYPKALKNGIDFQININAEKTPVTVKWNIVNPDGKHFVLSDANNGKALKAKEIAGSGSILLTKSGGSALRLQVTGGPALPREFSLSQNYPNPFNPSTKFDIGLPQAAHLEVIVYNILGQKVATLVDEARDAGYHTIIWDGNTQTGVPASTGIYFVRMNADKFTAVRKIMMMK